VDDVVIVERFWERSESAIEALASKYGKYMHTIAFNILSSDEDAEEIVNDTCIAVWNAIPPERPQNLRAYTGKTARNLSLNRLKMENRLKRGGGQAQAAMEELAECVADPRGELDRELDAAAVAAAINGFLSEQTAEHRVIFVARYWQVASIQDIAAAMQMKAGRVKSILHRMRGKLRKHLESEGITL